MLYVATDADGVLVDRNGVLFPVLTKPLRLYWQKLNIVIVSGRPQAGVEYILDQIGVDGHYIALNGGIVVPRKGQLPLVAKYISRDTISAIMDVIYSTTILAKDITSIFAYDESSWLAWGNSNDIKEEQLATGAKPQSVPLRGLADRANIIKLVVVCNDYQAWNRITRLLEGAFGTVCNIAQSREFYIEITDPSASKGTALSYLKKVLDCSTLVSIGDGKNDIPMFEVSDISYAPFFAEEDVRRRATHIIEMPFHTNFISLLERLANSRIE